MAKTHISKELDDLLKNELISSEQYSSISTYIASKKNKPLNTISVLPIIGVVLICSGLISITASNWRHLNDYVKVFFVLTPLLASTLILISAKKRNSRTFTECCAIVVGMLELLAFGVIANIFQTPVATEHLMQIVIASLIPLTYCYNTYWLSSILLAGVLYGADDSYLSLSILGLIAFIPFIISLIKRGKPVKLLTLLHLLASFRLVSLFPDGEVLAFLLIGVYGGLTVFYHEKFYNWIVNLFYMILLYASTIEGGLLCNMDEGFGIVLVLYPFIAFGLIYSSVLLYQKKMIDILQAKKYALYAVTLITSTFPIAPLAAIIVTSSLFYDVKHYYTQGLLKEYNKSSALLTLFLLSYMSVLDLPFVLSGIVAIITGSIFVGLSIKNTFNIQKQAEVLKNDA